MTKEEFEKAVEVCTDGNMNCTQCPLGQRFYKCGVYFTRYIKENEPALSANSTSSEVSVKEDTDNIHIDDSTLLDICQEELEAISEIAINDYPNGYLTGYIVALQNNIKRLRGGDGK